MKVAQADVIEKLKTLGDFGKDVTGDGQIASGEFERLDGIACVLDAPRG